MGEIRPTAPPVTLIVAAFSPDEAILDALPEALAEEFGPVALTGPRLPFTETSYYQQSMGVDLRKQIFAFERLRPADDLPAIKRRTNEMERSLPPRPWSVARPLNLDPGYVDSGKLVLASTKDHAHRLYLGQGIFAEVTLYLRNKQWESRPWTYPDYRLPQVQTFLLEVREYHRRRLQLSEGRV